MTDTPEGVHTVIGKQQFPDDPYVSPRHALVWRDAAGDLWIRDEGSTNGTWLTLADGGERFRIRSQVPIRPGDKIHIGRSWFIVPGPDDEGIEHCCYKEWVE